MALLTLRLGMVAATPVLTRIMPQWAWSNNDGYDTLALNWVETGTFALEGDIPTAVRLPAYPALIAATTLVAGASYPLWTMILQALLSTATGYLLFRLAETLFGRAPAIATLGLFLFHPQANNFVFRCATETLFTFLVTAFVYHAVRYVQTRASTDVIAAAGWLGLSLLTRQTLAIPAIICGVVLLTWCVSNPRRFRRRVAPTVMAFATVSLVVAPWLVRNYLRSGHAPVLQTWVGQPLVQGTHVSAHLSRFLRGEASITDLDREALSRLREQTARYLRDHPSTDRRPVAREVLADHYARRLARERIQAAPFHHLVLGLRNLALAPVLQMTWKSTVILMAWNWPLVIFSLVGLVHCLFRRPGIFVQALPVTLLFAYVLAVHAIVWPQARYVLPALVPFSIFAGLTLSRIVERVVPSFGAARVCGDAALPARQRDRVDFGSA